MKAVQEPVCFQLEKAMNPEDQPLLDKILATRIRERLGSPLMLVLPAGMQR
jgi:hypothetical protein